MGTTYQRTDFSFLSTSSTATWFILWLSVFPQWKCDIGTVRHSSTHSRNLLEPLNSNSSISHTVVTHHPPTTECEAKLPKKCSCSHVESGYSFTCYNAGLQTVPKLDFGPKLIRTLNLEKNKLTKIEMGDFFGLKIERLLLGNNTLSDLPLLAFWGLEYHLETLDLSFNQLRRVPSDALRLLRNLRSLSLTANRITMLNHYDFGYLKRLEVLALDRNPVNVVSPTAFAGTHLFLLSLDQIDIVRGLRAIPTDSFRYLRGLSLAKNDIDHIPQGWFQQFRSLQYLSFDGNKIDDVPVEMMTGVERSLRTMELNGNDLREVPVDTLRRLKNIEILGLSHNRLRKIYERSFNESHLLQTLDLSRNFLTQISAFAFHGLDNARRIDLRYNHLITLDDRTFYWPQPAGKEIFLAHNPWLCNCLMKWLKKEMKKKTELSAIFVDADEMECMRPEFLKGQIVSRVRALTCDHDYYLYYYYDDTEDNEADWDTVDSEYNDLDHVDQGQGKGKGKDNSIPPEKEEERDTDREGSGNWEVNPNDDNEPDTEDDKTYNEEIELTEGNRHF